VDQEPGRSCTRVAGETGADCGVSDAHGGRGARLCTDATARQALPAGAAPGPPGEQGFDRHPYGGSGLLPLHTRDAGAVADGQHASAAPLWCPTSSSDAL